MWRRLEKDFAVYMTCISWTICLSPALAHSLDARRQLLRSSVRRNEMMRWTVSSGRVSMIEGHGAVRAIIAAVESAVLRVVDSCDAVVSKRVCG